MLSLVRIEPLMYYGREAMGLRFTVPEVEGLLRTLKGIKWARKEKLWCLPLARESYDYLLSMLGDKLSFDTTALRRYLAQRKALVRVNRAARLSSERHRQLITQPLCPENLLALQAFQSMLTARGYSPRTLKTYSNELYTLLRLLGERPLSSLTKMQVQSYLLWLLKKRGYSEVHVHTAVNALKFYFEKVEGREREFYDLPRPKKPKRLPSVLAEEEMVALIQKTANLKHRALLMTAYSAGLRISELIALQLYDIDAKRMMIHIRQGKGKKDRMVPLSKRLLETLREYFKVYRPEKYLFEGGKGEPYAARSAQQVLQEAKLKAGIHKKGSIHMLRHSYATQLLEAGTDIRYIQAFLGHNSLGTTMIYTHIGKTKIGNIQSPLDKLDF